MQARIYYHHTDSGGVVYYANYLKFFEEARTEFFEARGIFIKELAEKDTLFVVCRQEIDYKLPAVYGDILEIEASIGNITGVKLEFLHRIKNQQGQVICDAKTIIACVDRDIKPKLIPQDVRGKLTPHT